MRILNPDLVVTFEGSFIIYYQTGFEFKKRRAFPVLEGVVVAAENEQVLLDVRCHALISSALLNTRSRPTGNRSKTRKRRRE